MKIAILSVIMIFGGYLHLRYFEAIFKIISFIMEGKARNPRTPIEERSFKIIFTWLWPIWDFTIIFVSIFGSVGYLFRRLIFLPVKVSGIKTPDIIYDDEPDEMLNEICKIIERNDSFF